LTSYQELRSFARQFSVELSDPEIHGSFRDAEKGFTQIFITIFHNWKTSKSCYQGIALVIKKPIEP